MQETTLIVSYHYNIILYLQLASIWSYYMMINCMPISLYNRWLFKKGRRLDPKLLKFFQHSFSSIMIESLLSMRQIGWYPVKL
jgi:hypothetical protein